MSFSPAKALEMPCYTTNRRKKHNDYTLPETEDSPHDRTKTCRINP